MGTEPRTISKADALAEAYKRGLLPPDKKAAYEEAQRRGLVGGQPAAVAQPAAPQAAPRAQAPVAKPGAGFEMMPSSPQARRDMLGAQPPQPMAAAPGAQYSWTPPAELGDAQSFADARTRMDTGAKAQADRIAADAEAAREAQRRAERREAAAAYGAGMDMIITTDDQGQLRPGSSTDDDIAKGIITSPIRAVNAGIGAGEALANLYPDAINSVAQEFTSGPGMGKMVTDAVPRASIPRVPVPEGLESTTGGLMEGLGQFLIARKLVGSVAPGGGLSANIGKDALAVGVGFDGSTGRMADMFDLNAIPEGPLRDYAAWLQTQPEDSPFVGRFKNMLEDMTMSGPMLAPQGVVRAGQAVGNMIAPKPMAPANAGGAGVQAAMAQSRAAPQPPPVGRPAPAAAQPSVSPVAQPTAPPVASQGPQPTFTQRSGAAIKADLDRARASGNKEAIAILEAERDSLQFIDPKTGQPRGKTAKTQAAPTGARSKSMFGSGSDYSVSTLDSGVFNARLNRTHDGGAVIFHDEGTIPITPEFAKGKSDEELLAYYFEPVGFQGATKGPTTQGAAQAAPQAPPAAAGAAANPQATQRAQQLLDGVDAGGIPSNPILVNRIARDLGLDVADDAPMADTIERVRTELAQQGQPTVTQGPRGGAQPGATGAGQQAAGAVPPAGPATLQGVPTQPPISKQQALIDRDTIKITRRIMRSAGIKDADVMGYLPGAVQRFESLNDPRIPLAFFLKSDLPKHFPEEVANRVGTNLDVWGRARNAETGVNDTSRATINKTVTELRKTQQSFLTDSAERNLFKGSLIGQEDQIVASLRETGRKGYEPVLDNARQVVDGRRVPTPDEAAAVDELRGILSDPMMLGYVDDATRIRAKKEGVDLDQLMQQDPIGAAHWLQSEFRRLSDAAEDAVTGKPTRMSQAYDDLRDMVLDPLKRAAPGYEGAMNRYGHLYGAKDAVRFGKGIFTAGRSAYDTAQKVRQFKKLGRRQQTVAWKSIRDEFLNEFRGTPEDAAAKVTRMQSEGALDILEQLGPRGKRFADDIRSIAQVENPNLRAIDQGSGSPTYSNQQGGANAVDMVQSPVNQAIGAFGQKGSLPTTLAGDAVLAFSGLPPVLTLGKGVTWTIDKFGNPSKKVLARATEGLYGLPKGKAPPLPTQRKVSGPRSSAAAALEAEEAEDMAELLRALDVTEKNAKTRGGRKGQAILNKIDAAAKAPPANRLKAPKPPPAKTGGKKPPQSNASPMVTGALIGGAAGAAAAPEDARGIGLVAGLAGGAFLGNRLSKMGGSKPKTVKPAPGARVEVPKAANDGLPKGQQTPAQDLAMAREFTREPLTVDRAQDFIALLRGEQDLRKVMDILDIRLSPSIVNLPRGRAMIERTRDEVLKRSKSFLDNAPKPPPGAGGKPQPVGAKAALDPNLPPPPKERFLVGSDGSRKSLGTAGEEKTVKFTAPSGKQFQIEFRRDGDAMGVDFREVGAKAGYKPTGTGSAGEANAVLSAVQDAIKADVSQFGRPRYTFVGETAQQSRIYQQMASATEPPKGYRWEGPDSNGAVHLQRADLAPPSKGPGGKPPTGTKLSAFPGADEGSKLPMDEGSRMQRAREMGFDAEFPVYHGSRRGGEFGEFQTSERGRFGPGVYFSEQPGVAGKYGEAKPYVVPTPDQLFDAMPRWNSLSSEAEQRIINQLRPHEKEKLLAQKDWYKREGEAFWEALRRSVDGEDGVLADARASEVIQAAGFKGIRGIGDGQETVIFNPKHVRRTDATFDPSQEGSSKLLSAFPGGTAAQAASGAGGAAYGYANPVDANEDGVIDDQDRAITATTLGLGGLTAAGLARNALSRGPRGVKPPPGKLNTFGGVNAKTADRAALARAQQMETAGASRDDIWDQTGWFKGVDGKWRFEIDDSGAKLANFYDPATFPKVQRAHVPQKPGEYTPQALDFEDYMSHPELERAYFPTREKAPSVIFDNLGATKGSYSEANDMLTMDSASFLAKDEGRSTALHELQHGVQAREGFARGGNPTAQRAALEQQRSQSIAATYDEMRGILDQADRNVYDAWNELVRARVVSDFDRAGQIEAFLSASEDGKRLLDLDWKARSTAAGTVDEAKAYEAYRRLAGETEARNVQTRRDFSPAERKAKRPWETQDVPDDQQIVRFGGGKAESRPTKPSPASNAFGGGKGKPKPPPQNGNALITPPKPTRKPPPPKTQEEQAIRAGLNKARRAEAAARKRWAMRDNREELLYDFEQEILRWERQLIEYQDRQLQQAANLARWQDRGQRAASVGKKAAVAAKDWAIRQTSKDGFELPIAFGATAAAIGGGTLMLRSMVGDDDDKKREVLPPTHPRYFYEKLKTDGAQVSAVQGALVELGLLDQTDADGHWGRKSNDALEAWLSRRDNRQTNYPIQRGEVPALLAEAYGGYQDQNGNWLDSDGQMIEWPPQRDDSLPNRPLTPSEARYKAYYDKQRAAKK